jgi:hypothetical protein
VEEHNGLRQPWGPVGAIKADRAGTFLRERVRAAQDRFVVGREFRQVRIPDRNVTMALTATNRERYLWVVSPDNHKARFAALELVEEVAGHHLSEHRVVLAGNEFEGGQAMGFRRGFEGWDLHPLDIHPELEAVEGAPERPKEEGCAAMLGQSAESNILTGMCVRRAVHRMIGGASAVEEAWNANLATGEGKFWTIL